MKKYAKIRIKTAKTYAMTAEEAKSQGAGVKEPKSIENGIGLPENPNLTSKNAVFLPILNNVYLDGRKKTKGVYTYDIFVDIYEDDTLKKSMYFYGHESNNFCYDTLSPNDFLKSKNTNQSSIINLNEIGDSETFYELELGPEDEFDIKKLFVSNLSLNVLGFYGECALKGVYYVRNLINDAPSIHPNEALVGAVNFIDNVFCEASEYSIMQRVGKRNSLLKEFKKEKLNKIRTQTKTRINQRYIFSMINGFLVESCVKKDYSKPVSVALQGFKTQRFGLHDAEKDGKEMTHSNTLECQDDEIIYLPNANLFIDDKPIKDWKRLIFKLPADDAPLAQNFRYAEQSKEKTAKITFNIPLDPDNFTLDDLYIGVCSSSSGDEFGVIGALYHIPKAAAKHIMDVCGKDGELRDHIEEIFKDVEKNRYKNFYLGARMYRDIFGYLNELLCEFKREPITTNKI